MVQMAVGKDKAKNVQHACQLIRNAAQKGANMIVLPVRLYQNYWSSLSCLCSWSPHHNDLTHDCNHPIFENFIFNLWEQFSDKARQSRFLVSYQPLSRFWGGQSFIIDYAEVSCFRALNLTALLGVRLHSFSGASTFIKHEHTKNVPLGSKCIQCRNILA